MRTQRHQTLEWTKLNLRIDVPLLEQLAVSADAEVRSVNAEIVARLRKSFAQDSAEQRA
jgi:hypothetical protein